MKDISIFGSTGSIGSNAVKLILNQKDDFNVVVLTGGKNIKKLAEQAILLKPKYVVIADHKLLPDLIDLLKDYEFIISGGKEALLQAASIPVVVALQAIVGFAGVECSIVSAKCSKILALANKESLVCAGSLLKQSCIDNNTTLIPVDSEHSAIFQCLSGENINTVDRIILTGSGGPFLNTNLSDLLDVTPEVAANHPNWNMGKRISIDSASMFNKAMELIETYELFDISEKKIEVLIHPESIIHSMVGFIDGAIIAQLGPADMTGAIGFALNYPNREELAVERLDFVKLKQLNFVEIDHYKFPAISLAIDAIKLGGLAGAAFNAAKEQSLDLFIEGKIKFLDMFQFVELALIEYKNNKTDYYSNIEQVIDQDQHTRDFVYKAVESLKHD
ncbi:1-deoxy-D-xylulose-5-phosphate reductoisomerase [Amylibacter sp.]|nr:1-deoxy-D-xylulose-5-phosphate reductoisomerase [Amylibacter sp.]MDC0983369.1 1-deoxy-D-xylulose-5-phosphate reductoisomerase [Amylibacter sp.]